MRLAIISDVHANLPALEAVLEQIQSMALDRIVCLGDVVGYGAEPDQCASLVREACDFTLLGNHDAATTGAMDEGYYYEAARDVIRWTRQHLSDDNYEWLYGLPFTRMEGDIAFFHSAPIMPSGFFYVVHPSEAQTHTRVFDALKSISFIGHAHLTEIFAITRRKAKKVRASDVAPTNDVKFIVNVGSVGQPRDHDPRACFVVWDSEQRTLDFQRVEYDIDAAARRIVEAGFDEKFAKRLYKGI